MRLLAFGLCGVLLEVAWLALSAISIGLSHSALFTAAFLDAHPLLRFFRDAPHGPLPWLPEAPLTEPLGAPAYVAPATALAVVMLWLAAGYVAALVLLERGAGSRPAAAWMVACGALVFEATCLFLPGLFSQDVFSYIAYGRLATVYDLNPYVWPPSVITRDAVFPWVAEVWRTYASPYGPVWVDVQAAMARVTGDLSIADQALAYRALANVLVVANLGLLWGMLGRLTPLDRAQRTAALAALAWNPLVLFELAANAHNDALMVTFTLLAFLLLVRSQNAVVSSASFTLGVLVKYLSGLGLVWMYVAAAARTDSWRTRALRLLAMALVTVLLVVAVAAPWLELPDSLAPLVDETAGVGYVNSIPDTLALAVADRLSAPLELTRTLERLLVLGSFVAYLVWELRRVWSEASPAAVARALARSSFIYVVAVSTSVQTWYFCLPVSVAVALGCRWRVTQLTLAYSVLALPALYLSYYLREATPLWVNLVYGLAPLLLLVPDLAARTRARPHVPAAETVGDDEQRARPHGAARAVVEEPGG
jgi:hypothetical protein